MYILTGEGLGQNATATFLSNSPTFTAPLGNIIPREGTFARVEYQINEILSNPDEVRRWRQQGSLLSDNIYRLLIEHPEAGENNQFRRYSFMGHDKCNLFALDIAWRSGFRVPLLNINTSVRPRYSYPLANMLTTYAERAYQSGDMILRGANGTQWGLVATSVPATEINDSIARSNESLLGGFMYILVGWRRSGTGHVGIIRRITSKTDDVGRIRDITYDGWEATTTQGAIDLIGRRWRTTQCGQLTGQCQNNPSGNSLNVFCAIHIIGLRSELVSTRRGVLTESTRRCRLLG